MCSLLPNSINSVEVYNFEFYLNHLNTEMWLQTWFLDIFLFGHFVQIYKTAYKAVSDFYFLIVNLRDKNSRIVNYRDILFRNLLNCSIPPLTQLQYSRFTGFYISEVRNFFEVESFHWKLMNLFRRQWALKQRLRQSCSLCNSPLIS